MQKYNDFANQESILLAYVCAFSYSSQLRVLGGEGVAQLISYTRPDVSGPKRSDFSVARTEVWMCLCVYMCSICMCVCMVCLFLCR